MVKVVGGSNASLAGRLSVAVDDSVDVLMGDSGPSGGSYVDPSIFQLPKLIFILLAGSCARMKFSRRIPAQQSWSRLQGLILVITLSARTADVAEDGDVVVGGAVLHGWKSTHKRVVLLLTGVSFLYTTDIHAVCLLTVICNSLCCVLLESYCI